MLTTQEQRNDEILSALPHTMRCGNAQTQLHQFKSRRVDVSDIDDIDTLHRAEGLPATCRRRSSGLQLCETAHGTKWQNYDCRQASQFWRQGLASAVVVLGLSTVHCVQAVLRVYLLLSFESLFADSEYLMVSHALIPFIKT